MRHVAKFTAIVFIFAFAPGWLSAADWFVSPNGKSTNQGTLESPWDLPSAVSGRKAVQPGDTIWLRAGIYTHPQSECAFDVSGVPGNPVIVRNWQNERATIDGAINVNGSDLWVWGLEVIVSAPRPDVPMPKGSHPPELKRPWGGIHGRSCERSKVINCILHDNNQGFSWWLKAVDTEIYGCIIYRNGWIGVDRPHGHAIYTQNDKGTKRIVDNIMFDPYSYLLHAYGSSRAYVNGFHVEGNILLGGTVLIGGGRPSERIAFVNNCTYKAATRFGYNAPHNEDVVSKDNYFAGDLAVTRYRRAVVTGNDFVLGARGHIELDRGTSSYGAFEWDGNRYVSPAATLLGQWREKTGFDRNSTEVINQRGIPQHNKIIVRPNKYEPGRANVAVFNWEKKSTVELDLSNVLTRGQSFEIRNVQDFFGKPVAEGQYQGGTVRVPLLRGAKKTELKLKGDSTGKTWQTFGDYPDFDAFVVLPIAEKQAATKTGR